MGDGEGQPGRDPAHLDPGCDAAATSRSEPVVTERTDAATGTAAVFAAIWALASLIHLTNVDGQGFDALSGWPFVLSAIAVFLRPSSLGRFMVFAVLQIVGDMDRAG